VSSCVWATDNRSFTTGSLDKSGSLIQWDLNGEKIYDWRSLHRVEDLVISPDERWLVAMDNEHHIHVYNITTREFEYKMDLKGRLTSLSMSQNSRDLLVNQTSGYAQLIDLFLRTPVQQYTGHKGGECMIRSSLGGADESFAISGSEGKSMSMENVKLTTDQTRWVHPHLAQDHSTARGKIAGPQP
jgi:WD40 repeat protein